MDAPAAYRIIVRGELSETWQDWFDPLTITVVHGSRSQAMTLLAGPVPDQRTLRRILVRLWDLNLELLSLASVTGAAIVEERS